MALFTVDLLSINFFGLYDITKWSKTAQNICFTIGPKLKKEQTLTFEMLESVNVGHLYLMLHILIHESCGQLYIYFCQSTSL